MSSINPLFKSYTLPDGNVITMLGGGAKVQKPLYTSYQNRGPKIVVAKRSGAVSYHDYGKVSVGYSSDFDDTFGTELVSMNLEQIDDISYRMTAEGSDMFAINTGETSLEFRVLNVQLASGESISYDLSDSQVVKTLLSSSTLVPQVQRIDSVQSPPEGAILNNVNSPSSYVNQSTQHRAFGDTHTVHFRVSDVVFNEFAVRDATGNIKKNSFGIPITSNIYGPFTYDVMVFAKDLNNDSTNQSSTTSIMRRQIAIDGLDNVSLHIVSTNGQTYSFANADDSFALRWEFNDSSATVSDFTDIRVVINNIDNTEIENVAFSSVVKNGTQFSTTVSNLSAIQDIGYRGEVKAYVQWKNVHWSPLNFSSPVTFSYSSQPLSTFIVYVSNSRSVLSTLEETQLYFKLMPNTNYNNYFATSSPHNVTFRFHDNSSRDDTSIRGSVNYIGLTNTNVTIYSPKVVSGLNPGTEYFVSYTVSDGRNPVYTGTISGSFFTRIDDRIPPVITSLSLVPMETSIRVSANVSDDIALEQIKIIAIPGNSMSLSNTELQTEFDRADYALTYNFTGVTANVVDSVIDKPYRFNAPSLDRDTLYTVVLRAADRANNTTFAKATTTTNPQIDITNVLFESRYQAYECAANLLFSDIPGVNIDYYMGVFTANVDSSNELFVKNFLTTPANAADNTVVLGTNIDASTVVRVQGNFTTAFDATGARTAVTNFNYYNLVIYAKASSVEYNFVTSLYQSYLQYKTDVSPPVISNIYVNFNVNMS